LKKNNSSGGGRDWISSSSRKAECGGICTNLYECKKKISIINNDYMLKKLLPIIIK
jgi:hypothetical protein